MPKKKFELSSGNVFADLGLQNPEEALVKSELAMQIHCAAEKSLASGKLSVSKLAFILGVDKQQASDLLNGRFFDFSIKELRGFLCKVKQE